LTTKKDLQSYEYYEMLDELIKLQELSFNPVFVEKKLKENAELKSRIERAIAYCKTNCSGTLEGEELLAILEGEDK